MHRLIKALSGKVHKKMEFEIEGDELALDKSIVECLNEPLVHLLRNAVDHGLESAEERAETSKDPVGRVRLTASRKGETAFIRVEDDGRGLDPAKIRAKAEEKELISPEDELTDAEIYQLVLRSGFSTASAVTDISGRGVGMDAVLNVIKNQLDGEITIDSELGKGTAFTLSIPLSRSANEGIVEALVCRLGQERYIIPSQDVVEIYVPREKDVVQLPDGRETVDVRGTVHSLIRLDRHLDVDSGIDDLTRAQTVVVRVGNILVSEVLRQQQVVITKFTVPVEDIFHLPILGYGMMGESDALVVNTEALLQGVDFAAEEQAAAS
jgi:two-component system chemotaxis sensor kinase CheA